MLMRGSSHILFLVFVRAAKRAMTKPETMSKSAAVIETLREKIQHIPASPTQTNANFQIRMLLELSRINIAFDAALQSQNFEQSSSAKIIEDTNWHLVKPGVRWLTWVLKFARRKPMQIAHTSNAFLWSYVFRKPFDKTNIGNSTKHHPTIAYDVTACPLQAYYHSLDAPHVCRAAACQLDHRMADEWGVSFRRTQTLAEGASRCDFRFHLKSQGVGGDATPALKPQPKSLDTGPDGEGL